MKENANEKALVVVNSDSKFYKIQFFLKNLLVRKKRHGLATGKIIIPSEIDIKSVVMKPKDYINDYFVKCFRHIEEDGYKFQELQELYQAEDVRAGVKVEEVDALCKLYEKQITKLKGFLDAQEDLNC